MEGERARSRTGILHNGSKERIQGKVGFNILSGTEHLSTSCFGTATEKPRLPRVLSVSSQCHPNWRLCHVPAQPHFAPSAHPPAIPSSPPALPSPALPSPV